MIGQTIGHYRITAKLGAGGMGEVYRAHDESRLDRDVALKVLPEEVTQDAERLARFDLEANLLASLKHPNIVTIYSVEETDGVHFLTMELVEGETMSEIVAARGLPLNRFFDLAIALIDAVNSAHGRGIVHRDLKPANIMVDEEGRLKVLDFGLAKLFEPGVGTGIQDDERTIALPDSPTVAGSVLGTPDYMSPEQAEGKSVDHRTDLFSLGVILYEMITGRHPFKGGSPASTVSSILRDTPSSLTDLRPELPRHLERIVSHCLAKETDRRYQSALDLRNDLEGLQREMQSTPSGEGSGRKDADRGSSRSWNHRWIAGVAVLAVAALVITGWFWKPWRGDTSPPPETVPNRVAVAPLENRTGDPTNDNLGVMAAEAIIQRFAETGAAETVALLLESAGTSEATLADRLIEQARQKGAALSLSGAYYLDGEALRFQTRLTDNLDGNLVYTFKSENVGQNEAAAGIETLSERVVAGVATHVSPDLDITVMRPPSIYKAYQAYQQATELWGEDYPAVIHHHRRGLELDPDFHMLRLWIVGAYINLHKFEQAVQALAESEEYLDRFTPFERALFRARRSNLSEDRAGQLANQRHMVELAPHISWVRHNRGNAALELNRPRETIEALTPDVPSLGPDYMPDAWWSIDLIAGAYHLLGEYERQIEIANVGLARFPGAGPLYSHKVSALAAMGQTDAVTEVIDTCQHIQLQGLSVGQGQVMISAACELRYYGQRAAADAMATRTVAWFEQQANEYGFEAQTPADLAFYAYSLRVAGRWQEARKPLIELEKTGWKPVHVKGTLGIIAAHTEGQQGAEHQLAQFPVSTAPFSAAIRLYWRACIAAHLGEKDRAVLLLAEAFAKGLPYTGILKFDDWERPMHSDADLEPLWHYPPFEELIKPKG